MGKLKALKSGAGKILKGVEKHRESIIAFADYDMVGARSKKKKKDEFSIF